MITLLSRSLASSLIHINTVGGFANSTLKILSFRARHATCRAEDGRTPFVASVLPKMDGMDVI